MKKKLVGLVISVVIMSMIMSLFPIITIAASNDTTGAEPSAHNMQVAAGDEHIVVLKDDGTVWAFGNNYCGQIGCDIEAVEESAMPIQVEGLTDICEISAGQYHTLALKNDGTVWAWGYNGSGQLGNGTTDYIGTPSQVIGLTDIKSISAGCEHSAALKTDGTVYTWGNNGSGQLGDGTTENSSVPIEVDGLTDIEAISAGLGHTIALKQDGTLCAWGANNYGQLGNGTTTSSLEPVSVSNLTDVTDVKTKSSHNIALKNDGTVYTWGYNCNGQLGNGIKNEWNDDISNCTVPAKVESLNNIEFIEAGSDCTAAINADGTAYLWGSNNSYQLGDGTKTSRYLPQTLINLTNVKSVSLGSGYTAALTEDGNIYSWGGNYYGKLGYEVIDSVAEPVKVTGLSDINGVTCDNNGTVVWTEDGNAYEWGISVYGISGDRLIDRSIPIRIDGLSEIQSCSKGNNYSVLLKKDGTVYANGINTYGQLGNGTNSASTAVQQIPSLTNVISVSAGYTHVAALKQDGTVWTWGQNSYGQLGNGTTTDSNVPVALTGLTGVQDIAAGSGYTVVLKQDKTVWAWGCNASGQLGNGTTTDSSVPVQVSGLTDIKAVAAGGSSTFAIKRDGTVYAWGANSYGQLGNGTTENSSVPVEVTGLMNIASIAAGNYHTAAVTGDGTLYTWGRNDYGQLGNGTNTNSSVPVEVTSLSEVSAVDCGSYNTAAVKNDGTVYTWGDNTRCQLGIGHTKYSCLPYKIESEINTPYNYIVSIAEQSTSVGPGTAVSGIGLPAQVQVELESGEPKDLNVTWDTSAYDPNQLGEQIIYGTVQLDGGIRNPRNCCAEYKIVVGTPPQDEITDIEPVQITADQGLPLDIGEKFHADGSVVTTVDVPQTVTVQLNNNEDKELNVTWDDSTYDPFEIGEQTVTGTVELVDDIENPNNIQAQLEVTVVPAEYFVFARTPETISIEVLAGTTKEEIYEQLTPKTIDVVAVNAETYAIVYIYSDYTFSDDYQDNLNFNPNQAGVQKLIGRFNPAITDAHIAPYVEINVNVVKRTIRSAAAVMIGNVNLGTPFEDIPMPDKAGVIYTDNTNEEFPVIWNGSTYNAEKLGAQIVYGNFADSLPVYVENPNNRRPMAGITVVDPTTTILSARPVEEIQIMYSSEYSVNNIDIPEEVIPGYIIRDYEVELLHEDGSVTTEIMPMFEEVND